MPLKVINDGVVTASVAVQKIITVTFSASQWAAVRVLDAPMPTGNLGWTNGLCYVKLDG